MTTEMLTPLSKSSLRVRPNGNNLKTSKKDKKVNGTNKDEIKEDFIALKVSRDFKTELRKVVKKHNNKMLRLKNCPNFPFTVCGQEGTNYRNMTSMMDAWNSLFLDKEQDMTVIGCLDNVPSLALGLQWVVLVTEDGAVYGYENECMCRLASSVKDLFLEGPRFGGKMYEMDLSDIPQDSMEFDKACQDLGIQTRDPEVEKYMTSLESKFGEMEDFFASL